MATIADLPYEVWNIIIFLLVQSSNDSADLARILSVCRTFLSLREDVSILKVVRFNNEIQFNNLYMYQKVNGLLVRCSEAGNTAARFLLGKVVLLSFCRFISESRDIILAHRPCDPATLHRILATNFSIRNSELVSFMCYFLPQASTSEASQTKLVHHQLLKVFLYYCSPRDMVEFIMSYFKYFARINEIGLHECAKLTFVCASRFRIIEELAEIKRSLDVSFMMLSEVGALEVERRSEDPSSTPISEEYDAILGQLLSKHEEATVVWQVVLNGDPRDFKPSWKKHMLIFSKADL